MKDAVAGGALMLSFFSGAIAMASLHAGPEAYLLAGTSILCGLASVILTWGT